MNFCAISAPTCRKPGLSPQLRRSHDAFARDIAVREASQARACGHQRGDFRLELFEIPGAASLSDDRRYPDRDLRTQGVKHMAYAVPDVATLVADLKSRGVEIAWDVVVHDGFTVAFVRDNSGNLVELIERRDLW